LKSLGLAVEDLAAAAYVFQKAEQQNAGRGLNFKGVRKKSSGREFSSSPGY
jgi:hypothetical protein